MFGRALRLLAFVLLATPSSGNVARDDPDPLKSENCFLMNRPRRGSDP